MPAFTNVLELPGSLFHQVVAKTLAVGKSEAPAPAVVPPDCAMVMGVRCAPLDELLQTGLVPAASCEFASIPDGSASTGILMGGPSPGVAFERTIGSGPLCLVGGREGQCEAV